MRTSISAGTDAVNNAAALLPDPRIGLLASADVTTAVTTRLMYQRHDPLIVTVKIAERKIMEVRGMTMTTN